MFDKVLIANRGAIACRIIRTLKAMGVRSVAVYSEADAHSPHVRQADEAYCIGPAQASASYLDMEKVLAAAEKSGAGAIHPGYGFLSENAGFAEACEARGIVFLGPTPQQMRDFGLKHRARELAAEAGVPMLPGSGLLADAEEAKRVAAEIGFPVMLKSTAGGGGIGMQLCRDADHLAEAFASVQRLGKNNFANAGIFLERFVERARHVEVQIFGDGKGHVIALGERDCSLQRRNQKVIEETPAPDLSDEVRAHMLETAQRLGASVHYRSAGTVEFIYDPERRQYSFLEVNTRLQVEHGITEAVTGLDLVEWMVRVGAGELPADEIRAPRPQGHAIEARVYAEDPGQNYRPSVGLVTSAQWPQDVRCDTWIESRSEVTPFYDPMLAKIIVHADSREAALAKMDEVLGRTELAGIETNLAWLQQVITDPTFAAAHHSTRYLDRFVYHSNAVEVLAPGIQTSVQDWPGRVGYWDVGVPPSGPMDDFAFRLANRLLGNPADAAALEITVNGPTLRFRAATRVCLTGAAMDATVDGQPVPWWQPFEVPAGGELRIGELRDAGARAYLAVRGGIQVPRYLGSRATFALGLFGGHGGRVLRVGDVLHLAAEADTAPAPAALPEAARPAHAHTWEMRVIYGPHGAPDFFTDEDIATFFATDWEVHYNSSRTGVRLIGPKPQWARPDGGEAGLHPSNIHDNAYAVGTVDFTGDMPVILGPDGPSLGGFVCPATIIAADLWKLGQLSPGDRVRFLPVDDDTATALEQAQKTLIETLQMPAATPVVPRAPGDARILTLAEGEHPTGVVYRPCGDKYLLVEYGPQMLDIRLRFRVHALMLALQEQPLPGMQELTPGIRSLQIHYDSATLPLTKLLAHVREVDAALGSIEGASVPSRIVHLPLSWDDPSTRLAIEKYMHSVRPDAPWCPSNIEFIRRINGLDSIEDVRRIVFDASYLVMGLGDVYLGAPVATPMDPRHRLVTTKYNPARTWTPENAVGIGGSYMCVYGMEGPGGYQFVGRTVQMWSRYPQGGDFAEKPWLLRFFDQVRFYPVSPEELLEMREAFPRGELQLQMEESHFDLGEYDAFLREHADTIATFKQRQQNAFEEERERWAAAGQDDLGSGATIEVEQTPEETELGENEVAVQSHVHGSIWQLDIAPGDHVEAGQTVLVLESMKMEIALQAECSGTVSRVLCQAGAQVAPGQTLLVIDTAA